VHDAYKTTGPDGKLYPTWHPITETTYECTFGHEHGSDPREFIGYSACGMPPFGYVDKKVRMDFGHVDYKVYVVNANTRGKGMLRSFHMGTSLPMRSTMRWHELQVCYVGVSKPDVQLAYVRGMADFGLAPSCHGKVFPDDSGYDYPSQVLNHSDGKNWAGNGTFRLLNVRCDDGTRPHQNGYEQWQGALNIDDKFKSMFNYNVGDVPTIILENDPHALAHAACPAHPGDWTNPECKAGNTRQLKYFGEIVRNISGETRIITNPFGYPVDSRAPDAIIQNIPLAGWDTYGHHLPDGVYVGNKAGPDGKELMHNGYIRFGLRGAGSQVYVLGNNWHYFGYRIVHYPN
jgi:hypothetical protein